TPAETTTGSPWARPGASAPVSEASGEPAAGPAPDWRQPERVDTRQRVLWAISDALAVTRRNLIAYTRIPQLIVFSSIQPIMFVLLFRYVFGGAIAVPGVRYVDFLMPGIFVQTVCFGAVSTGVGLAEDLNKGLIERFRSLPMARSAVLAGRTTADLFRNLFVVVLMTVVGIAVGFRPDTNVFAFLAGVGLI